VEYRDAGVDREGGYRVVEGIRRAVESTHDERVLNGLGGFGALYRLGDYREPILVSGTDGVGTKLQLAAAYDYLEGVGQDCVAMCVNDILCHGAEPLFFLDYVAYADLSPAEVSRIVIGVAQGCEEAGCALVGGESAQMPGTYQSGDFDLAGFALGVVEKGRMLDGRAVRGGDVLVGFDSSGLHSNGFSLVRAMIDSGELDPERDFQGQPLWRRLLEPTRIYSKALRPLLEAGLIHGLAHITGGGLYENVPRMWGGVENSSELCAVIEERQLAVPPIFALIQSTGVARDEMLRTFNMGVGMVAAAAEEDLEPLLTETRRRGLSARELGRIERGRETVCIV